MGSGGGNKRLWLGLIFSVLFCVCTVWITVDTLFVSDGEEFSVLIEDYSGSRWEDLTFADWMDVRVTYCRSAEFPVGTVIAQTPPAGSRRKRSGRYPTVELAVTVSLGPETVTLPNVIGSKAESAEQMLRELGFSVVLTRQESPREIGTVVETEPCAGTELSQGKTVRIIVSNGMRESVVQVPNVCGMSRSDALITLWLSHLAVNEVIEESNELPERDGTVLRQSHCAGTWVRAGTVVTLYLSRCSVQDRESNTGKESGRFDRIGMTYRGFGRVSRSVGGLFTVRLLDGHSKAAYCNDGKMPLDGCEVFARGRGALHRKDSLLVGDWVEIRYDDTSFMHTELGIRPSADATGISIDRICDRKNALIRPPMANLDFLFVTLSVTSPDPILETVDKLICIAEFNHIEPVIVLTKCELDPSYASSLAQIYRNAGFELFCTGCGMDRELHSLESYVQTHVQNGKLAAFSGASGVGKSTLLNRLFPSLSLETGELSRRIERGKNTTRCVSLYPLSETADCGYLADTPGFTMLDFERFHFFEKEDLPLTFREFLPYLGTCRYTKCTHTSEQGCAVLEAVREGRIAASRHASFLALYQTLKKKSKW